MRDGNAPTNILNNCNLVGQGRRAHIRSELGLDMQWEIDKRTLRDIVLEQCRFAVRISANLHEVLPHWPPWRSAVIGTDFIRPALNVRLNSKWDSSDPPPEAMQIGV